MLQTGPIRGDFPSLKLHRMVRYTSTIERDLLYFLEYRQDVTWYQEHPFTIEYPLPEGQLRRYTPDYEIHEGSTKTLIECKPEARLDSAHAQQQRQIGQQWAATNGYQFVTMTDTELRAGHTLATLQLWWRYARWRATYPKSQIVEAVTEAGRSSVERLCHHLKEPPAIVLPAVCYLLFHHSLQMDLHLPFTPTSTLWIAQGALHGTHPD